MGMAARSCCRTKALVPPPDDSQVLLRPCWTAQVDRPGRPGGLLHTPDNPHQRRPHTPMLLDGSQDGSEGSGIVDACCPQCPVYLQQLRDSLQRQELKGILQTRLQELEAENCRLKAELARAQARFGAVTTTRAGSTSWPPSGRIACSCDLAASSRARSDRTREHLAGCACRSHARRADGNVAAGAARPAATMRPWAASRLGVRWTAHGRAAARNVMAGRATLRPRRMRRRRSPRAGPPGVRLSRRGCRPLCRGRRRWVPAEMGLSAARRATLLQTAGETPPHCIKKSIG